MIKCFISAALFCACLSAAPAGWSDTVPCPSTEYPFNAPEKEPKGFESGKIILDPNNNSASVFCRYDDDRYELFLHWRKPDVPPQEGTAVCYNDSGVGQLVSSADGPAYQVRTYMTQVDFGIQVKEQNGEFFVDYAEKYSPGFDAGLDNERGAKIVAINGETLAGKDLKEVYVFINSGQQEVEEGKVLLVKIQPEGADGTKELELRAKPYDPLVGAEIYVPSLTNLARVEVRIDPHKTVTEEMKIYWIGKARELLSQIEPQAQACE